MTLRDPLDPIKDLPPETPVCVAEEDKAAGMNVSSVEILQDARRRPRGAEGVEAVEFEVGDETVVVLRW